MASNDPMYRPKLLLLGRIFSPLKPFLFHGLSSLLFIEYNHMMHLDNRPIMVRNNRTCRIGKTTLVNPPSWSVMMFNKICFIRSKSIFFYLYHFFHLTGTMRPLAYLQAILFPSSQLCRFSRYLARTGFSKFLYHQDRVK